MATSANSPLQDLLPMELPLTRFQQAGPARITPRLESGPESTKASGPASSGKRSGSSGSCSPESSSSKTSQGSFQSRIPTQNIPLIAYVAGLVDGEGTIGVMERTNSDCVRRSFSVRMSVEMAVKAEPVLRRLHHEFGGTIKTRSRKGANHADQMTWSIHTKDALPVMEAILPYMIVKREACRLAIEACRLLQAKPSDFEAQVSLIKQLIHEQNRTGKQAEPKPGWFARVVDGQWITRQRDLANPAGWEMFSGLGRDQVRCPLVMYTSFRPWRPTSAGPHLDYGLPREPAQPVRTSQY